MPPQKRRSPEGVASEFRGVDLVGKANQPQNSLHDLAEQDLPLIWVTSGRDELGKIYQDGARFLAVGPRGGSLGTFSTIKGARAVTIEAAGGRIPKLDVERRRRRRAA